MAHFAKLDLNGNVLEVLVVDNKYLLDPEGNESEVLGQTFLFNLTGHRLWKQTSYSGKIRKNFAGVGYVYDPAKDAFIEKQPHKSWVLNDLTCKWEAPTQQPKDGKFYEWDEKILNWKKT